MSEGFGRWHKVACPFVRWAMDLSCNGHVRFRNFWESVPADSSESVPAEERVSCREAYADFCAWAAEQPQCVYWKSVDGIPEDTLRQGAVPAWLAARAEGRWPVKPAPPEGPAACGTEWVADGQVQFGAPMDRQPTATSTLKEPRCSSCGGEWDSLARRCYRRCWRAHPVHGE